MSFGVDRRAIHCVRQTRTCGPVYDRSAEWLERNRLIRARRKQAKASYRMAVREDSEE